MGKYKKWKRLVSVSTAACMAIAAASLTGCSGGDSGSSQSGNENAEKKDAIWKKNWQCQRTAWKFPVCRFWKTEAWK